MGLLRIHIADHAGRRVPLYRTGTWPYALAHEVPIPDEEWVELLVVRSRLLRRPRRRRKPVPPWRLTRSGVVLIAISCLAYWAVSSFIVPRVAGVPTAVVVSILPFVILAMLAFAYAARGALPSDAHPEVTRRAMLRLGRCASCGFRVGRGGVATCPECAAVWRFPRSGARANEKPPAGRGAPGRSQDESVLRRPPRSVPSAGSPAAGGTPRTP